MECDESGNYERCLKMGRRSRADCTDRTCVIGAEEMIFPSVSVALSRVLPGPAVPGFQNCRDMTFVYPLTVDGLLNSSTPNKVKQQSVADQQQPYHSYLIESL